MGKTYYMKENGGESNGTRNRDSANIEGSREPVQCWGA